MRSARLVQVLQDLCKFYCCCDAHLTTYYNGLRQPRRQTGLGGPTILPILGFSCLSQTARETVLCSREISAKLARLCHVSSQKSSSYASNNVIKAFGAVYSSVYSLLEPVHTVNYICTVIILFMTLHCLSKHFCSH